MAIKKKTETITAYKGFDKDLKCRGFQYEIGKTYQHDGDAKACESGFHACEHPLDVLYYYAAGSRYALVEQSGQLSRHGDDTKVSSSKIKIKAEIGIAGLVHAAVEYVNSRCWPVDPESPASATGFRGAASATGYQVAASATGGQGAASATGGQGAASATGDHGAASATGYHGAASATGNHGAASAMGYQGAASATGDQGAASATGDHGAASATGYQVAASATGYHGAASATGDQGAASATGDHGAASATGNQGAASATGDHGAASATGDRGAAMATGFNARVMGAKGNALFAVYRKEDNSILHAKAAIVGEGGIKDGVWYSLNKDGEFVEV